MTGLRVSLFIAVAIISATHATNLIYKIGVNTAACDDCGMSNTFGALRMQVKLLIFDIRDRYFNILVHKVFYIVLLVIIDL